MKANVQHLGLEQRDRSFECYWVRSPEFGFHWHYHRALEITYVVQGRGIRMVGDNVSYFSSGDLVLLGSNLPHTWISDDEFNANSEHMQVVVLQFLPELFGEEWLALPEMRRIRSLLQKVRRGISFSTKTSEQAGNLLRQLTKENGVFGLQRLMSVFHVLSEDEETVLLSSKGFTPVLNEVTEERLLRVCQYMHEHFTTVVRLDTLAALANMNTSAFCRFFSRATGQTVTDYLNDLRIGKACNLLIDRPKMTISQVAHTSGYSSQTLFNRCFRRKKGVTPREFRTQFKGS